MPEDGLRLRKATTQRMMADIAQHRHDETESRQDMEKAHSAVLYQVFLSYLKVVGFLLAVGLLALAYFQPSAFVFWKGDELPPRDWITLYPRRMSIKRALPKFFMNYAIATPENANVRAAVKKVAALRSLTTYTKSLKQSQTVKLYPWEHDDFLRQMKSKRKKGDPPVSEKDSDERMNRMCGSGFASRYRDVYASERYRNDLVWACLLSTGTHDGYIQYNLTAHSSFVRGTQGVAAKYVDQDGIWPGLLILPILNYAELQAAAEGSGRPSTRLPRRLMRWLIGYNGDYGDQYYRRSLEDQLYAWIAAEQAGDDNRWTLWNAACTTETRDELDKTQRKMATTCPQLDNETNTSVGSVDCCSLYDPALKPIVRRERLDDDEE